jgi:hypothetical protein
VPDFGASAGAVAGAAAGAVVWATASETAKIEDETTSPNTPAYPRKVSALRRQTCFGSDIFKLPVCWPADQSFTWSASSHAGIPSDGIDALGRCGMMVPAVTINPSVNLARAKSRACASVTNVFVKRGCRRLSSVPSIGTSKMTYHVYFIPRGRSPSSVAILRAETNRDGSFSPQLPANNWFTAARRRG